MAVNYKIGADASSFKQGVNEAQASLKTLDAALKVNEASFRAGGDAQVYMEQKTQLLTDKMNRQKQLVTQLQQGMQQMRAQGVAPTSVEYQKLEQRMLNAQTAMLETKSSIDVLDQSQQAATQSAGTLADSVNSIGKKISLDQVIGGINTITSTMESPCRIPSREMQIKRHSNSTFSPRKKSPFISRIIRKNGRIGFRERKRSRTETCAVRAAISVTIRTITFPGSPPSEARSTSPRNAPTFRIGFTRWRGVSSGI